MISEETISKIRESIDMTEVIGEFVPNLKRAGKDFKALCPFHQEKTPSFMVSPAKGIFHCFGCGVGGDVFKFVMEMEHCSYPESITKLAERKGIPIEMGNQVLYPAKDQSKRKQLLNLLQRAAQYYHKTLLESQEAEPALQYLLQKRRLSRETIQKFQLGWAPARGQAILSTALKSGCSENDLVRAGLIVRSQRSGKWLDWMRGRVVFPILDVKGQVLGFGGRVLESQKWSGDNPPPKYLNSPETEIFQKGKNLYGFYQASKAIRGKDEALVMEGYMDVISCHQAGIENAVAPLGTSLTIDQCQILKRYVERVTLMFDRDQAGESATLRGSELLLEYGFLPMIASLEGFKDVDEFLQTHSLQDFGDRMSERQSIIEFKLQFLWSKAGNASSEVKRVSVVQGIFPLLSKITDEIAKSEMLKLVSDRMNVSVESLIAQWNQIKGKSGHKPVQNGVRKRSEGKSPESGSGQSDQQRDFLTAEEEVLCLAVSNTELREKLLKMDPSIFSDPALLECLGVLRQNPDCKEVGNILNLLGRPASHAISACLLIFRRIDVVQPHEIFDSLLKRIKQKNSERKLKILSRVAADSLNRGEHLSQEVVEFQQLAPAVKGSHKDNE